MEKHICEDCKKEIDPDWCWCGDSMVDHYVYHSNHSPVPMGCICCFYEYDTNDFDTDGDEAYLDDE